MVPPAAATTASALLGMDPPLNATKYDWAGWLDVSALVVSVTGSTDPSPQPASEKPTNAATNNDDDRIGLSMGGLLGNSGTRAYTRARPGPPTIAKKLARAASVQRGRVARVSAIIVPKR